MSDAQKAVAVTVREPRRLALDAEWRTIRSRPYVWLPHDRPRSVVLPVALLTFGICGAPFLVFFLAEVVAR